MKKILPRMNSDEEAESFLDEELSEYLTPENFTSVSFEFTPKDTTISLRISQGLLDVVKVTAAKRGIGYQKFIRESIERAIREN